MPTGLIIMKWDERVGINIAGSYPEEVSIQERTMMQIYSQHEYSGESGMVTLMSGAVNIASYYTGPETGIYVLLLLTAEEDGDVFEEGMVEITREILANIEPAALKAILPPLFQKLSVFPTLNEEQRIAMIYNSNVKKLILERLREESLISKSEIAIWLKDRYEEGFVDLESVMSSLSKTGLIKIASVQGLTSDMVFLTKDIVILRIPPVELYKNPTGRNLPASLVNEYKSEVTNFFKNYRVDPQDNAKVIDEVILDPSVYETILLLRQAIVTKNDLEKLKKKGVDNVDRVLKVLWENKMIAVFKDDKGTEYYSLISDFNIKMIFPTYNIDTICEQYRSNTKNRDSLLQALDILRDDYYSMVSDEKAKKKDKVEAE